MKPCHNQMTSLIQGMVGVVIVGAIASSICAYLFFLIQPIVMKWIMDIFTAPPNTSKYFKEHLDIGTFRKFYHQAHPVYFASTHHDNNVNMVINHSYCSAVGEDAVPPLSEGPQCTDTVQHDFCEVHSEDEATASFAAIAKKVLCGSAMPVEALSTPRLVNTKQQIEEDISTFDSPPHFIVSKSRYGVTARPTFQQHPQTWEYLMLGRKLWLLYRPGGTVLEEE